MKVEVKVPELAESITEAVVGEWLKKPGDYVEEGEQIVDIETDKVILEITAPNSGEITEITKDKNTQVQSNEVLALINSRDTKQASNNVKQTANGNDNEATSSNVTQLNPEDSSSSVQSDISKLQPDANQTVSKTSPAVRKLAFEHDIDVKSVKGTGKGGRITKKDIQSYIQKNVSPQSSELDVATEIMQAPIMPMLDSREDKRVPMTSLRKSIARRLISSQQETAMLTTFNEVNMQEVITLRQKHKEAFEEAHTIKLGFMSFFIKAVVDALQEFPVMNAYVEGNDIVYHNYFDIGVAVSTQKGLIVPVIRDAQNLSFAEIEQNINDFAQRAYENKLTIEELTGGTFSITNGGVFGSMMSTPIINPPQSAILGMHSIQARPIAQNGEVVIAPMMYLALSYDHRIIDGKDAVQFLVHIKNIIEDPTRLLLQV